MKHDLIETMDLKQAAAFLKMHPVTLQAKAKAGEIPAAKPAKCWAFIKDDLVIYLRSLYSCTWRTLVSDKQEIAICHSISERTPPFGGFVLPTKDAEYRK
ncbi:MAG: helix-turn-helix domain-containing protein, partial [Phormidesmis sp. FL-bin-119]|nr:helix-turn-helix domain-containing protein [Pedobacter sp.]